MKRLLIRLHRREQTENLPISSVLALPVLPLHSILFEMQVSKVKEFTFWKRWILLVEAVMEERISQKDLS